MNSPVRRNLQRAKLSIYSSSRSKIEDKGKDEPADSDSQEWGRTIVAGNRLQENLVKSVSCRFCHVYVTLLQAPGLVHLGSCPTKTSIAPRGI